MPSDNGNGDGFAFDQDQVTYPDEGDVVTDGSGYPGSPIDRQLRNLHTKVEAALLARAGPTKRTLESAGIPYAVHGILGVGIGSAERDSEQIGRDGPGSPVLNIYIAEPAGMEDVKRAAVDHLGLRELAADSMTINVICTGIITPQAYSEKLRPSPNGISIGQVDVKAGTQGVLARGRSGDRANQCLILSNNHVLANLNAAQQGSPILQPGPYDGGQDPEDRIAALERYIRLHFDDRINFVDCATALAADTIVNRKFMYRSGGKSCFFSVSDECLDAHVGMQVGKNGRTTELTNGRIVDVNASITVNYQGGGSAFFRDQITVLGNNGAFSNPGDSGSLIWTWDRTRNPVGLLFAGGNGYTFGNKISRVLIALDIDLYT